MRSIEARAEYDVQIETLWAVLTDTAAYPEWNPFIRRVDGALRVGERVRAHIVAPGGPGMRLRPRVTAVQAPHRLAWLGHVLVRGLFDGAHEFELTALPGGRTGLVQRETFTGVLVRPLAGTLANTRLGFEQMHEALRARLSALAGQGPAS